MRTASATLERARFARGIGDVDACLRVSEATMRQAQFEHDYETLYWAAEVPGRMYMGRGEPHLAIPHYRDALDRVLMHGPIRRLAGAYHDLALAEREAGNRALFREHAVTAYSLYRDTNPEDPGLIGLQADMASDDWERDPDNPDRAVSAYDAWRKVPASMRTPHYKLAAAAQQMATCVVLDLRLCYDAGARALELFRSQMPNAESVALILTYAARGSLAMRDFELAANLAERAEHTATLREEMAVREQAAEVKEAAYAERAGARS